MATNAPRGPGDATGGDGSGAERPVRVRLEGALISLFKEYYGRGPAAAKAALFDQYAVVALEGGLTRNEQTLIATGHEADVRAFRLAFQESVRDQVANAVTEATGRRVIGYHSQIIFDPPCSFELFVFEPEPGST